MSDIGEHDDARAADASSGGRSNRRRGFSAVLEVCPYLVDESGTWRSAYAAREHRCHAVRPPAQLAITKQRQLCLLPGHSGCATFVAAREVAAASAPDSPGDEGAALWPATAATPVVLEPARRMSALPGATAKSGGQALLVGLMVLAFIVLVIARTQSPPTTSGAPTTSPAAASATTAAGPSPTTVPTPSPAASDDPTPDPTPAPTEAPTVKPTAKPTPRPTTASSRTYKVKAGDTLSGIAARFGTTVKVLAELNKIADPRIIRTGQVLVIP